MTTWRWSNGCTGCCLTVIEPGSSGGAYDSLLNAEVRARMKTLNPTFREALWLFVVEGLSIREIADILGIPEATVKTRIHRAKAQLKEQLNPDTPGGVHVMV